MSLEDALADARALQNQVEGQPEVLPHSPYELIRSIRGALIRASDEGLLRSAPHDVIQRVRERTLRDRIFIMCGESMDRGEPGGENFLFRRDGARLSFSIEATYRPARALVGYRFHLQYPDGKAPPFLRFDLNRPGGDHEPLREPRRHLHPGSDDLRVQTPVMSPMQILLKLVYDS